MLSARPCAPVLRARQAAELNHDEREAEGIERLIVALFSTYVLYPYTCVYDILHYQYSIEVPCRETYTFP
jgi:hypothetical protein